MVYEEVGQTVPNKLFAAMSRLDADMLVIGINGYEYVLEIAAGCFRLPEAASMASSLS